MATLNRVIIAGNLVRDPELKFAGSGTAIGTGSICVNNRVKKGEEWVDEPCFVDFTFFGRSAEVLNEYCKKGSNILVDGRLKMEQWEKDGQKRSKICVIGENLQLLGGRPAASNDGPKQESRPTQQNSTARQAASVGASEDIPF